MGIAFEVHAPDIEEREEGDPAEAALANATAKAQAVWRDVVDSPVLGVDTVVALDGRIYGKPGDEVDARATLGALGGRRHEVISGICLLVRGGARSAVARTAVRFRALSDELIQWYLGTGEWRGRAGGYAIQGRGAALVAGIEGDYLNVVGLPLATLLDLVPDFPALLR